MDIKLLDRNIEPRHVNEGKTKFNHELEGLRGLAAVMVFIGHFFHKSYFVDPHFNPSSTFSYFVTGHGAVLIFFVLSGYVIGLTNKNSFTRGNFINYLKRRFIRLYPIYIPALFITIILSREESFIKFLYHLLFLQNFEGYYFFEASPYGWNAPLWSLSYEVFFYIFFGFIWYKKPNYYATLAGCFIVSILGWYGIVPEIISGLSTGLLFWIAGLVVAWSANEEKKNDRFLSFWGVLVLLIVVSRLAPFEIILSFLRLKSNSVATVSILDLFLLPICIYLICVLTGKKVSQKILLVIYLIYITCFLIFIYLIISNRILEADRWIMSGILFTRLFTTKLCQEYLFTSANGIYRKYIICSLYYTLPCYNFHK